MMLHNESQLLTTFGTACNNSAAVIYKIVAGSGMTYG